MILFRADGNKKIGSGHVMRCLSIADCAKASGETCAFLTASDDLKETVAAHGHKVTVLDKDYDHMMSDLFLTKKWIEDYCPSAFIVDSYYVSDGYLSSLKECCMGLGTKLVYMDDAPAFPYPCDVLVNYNIYGADMEDGYRKLYQKGDAPRLLLGPAYAPLRDEFQDIGIREVRKEAVDILVSTGGADFGHVSLGLAKEILYRTEELHGLHFHFVIGPMNEDAAKMDEITKNSGIITAHFNVQRMSGLMQSCDIAIAAAGSTLYELCAAQTPAVTYILADNQIPGAEGFERHGIMRCVGDLRLMGVTKLADALVRECKALAGDHEERRRIAGRQRDIVDGKGAGRILKRIGVMQCCTSTGMD